MYEAKHSCEIERIAALPGVRLVMALDPDGDVRLQAGTGAPVAVVLLVTGLLELQRTHGLPLARLALDAERLAVCTETARLGDGLETVAVVFGQGDPVVKSLHRVLRQAWGLPGYRRSRPAEAERQSDAVTETLAVLREAAREGRRVEVTWHKLAREVSNLGIDAAWPRRGVPREVAPGSFELRNDGAGARSWRFVVGQPERGVPSIVAARMVRP